MSTRLRAVAQDNERFIAESQYDHATAGRVLLGDAVRAAADATRTYYRIDLVTFPVTHRSTRFEVTPESSLAAAERCHADNSGVVGGPNFASARNPGGGYLNGAKAQEEDLCRCSALYTCLLRAPEFYAAHRASSDLHYSDRVISSPGVPVFRDDRLRLLPKPYPVTFLTSAAPNSGQLALRAPELLAEIPELLAARAARDAGSGTTVACRRTRPRRMGLRRLPQLTRRRSQRLRHAPRPGRQVRLGVPPSRVRHLRPHPRPAHPRSVPRRVRLTV
jgi:uncharacterized protein (TIGR02452 family)